MSSSTYSIYYFRTIKSSHGWGTEQEFGPGDAAIIPPGHDAWVIGNESVVAIDFTGLKDYAKKE